MTTTTTAAKQLIKSICKNAQVFFTNEGFEVAYTSNQSNEATENKASLESAGFSNVIICGKKVKSIKVNFVSRTIEAGLRISSVTF